MSGIERLPIQGLSINSADANSFHPYKSLYVSPVQLYKSNLLNAEKIPRFIAHGENVNGFDTETRVGFVISRLKSVKEVRQAEPNGIEDFHLIDLIATMVDGFPVSQFFVQVKSRFWGVADFYDHVGERIDEIDPDRDKSNGDVEFQRRRAWMLARRFIVINGGMKKSGRVSDEYIAEKFAREAAIIVESERVKHFEDLAGYLSQLSDVA